MLSVLFIVSFHIILYQLLDSSATLGAEHKAELRQLLEQANLITYLDGFLNTGRSHGYSNLPYGH